MAEHNRKHTAEEYAEVFNKHGGNVSATARELGVNRHTVTRAVRNLPWAAKPVAGGKLVRTSAEVLDAPPKGRVRRYLLTSAQNNTFVNQKVWESLNALATHYGAGIMVGTFTYNTNAYGRMSVKRGKEHVKQSELWYDPCVIDHLVDNRVELGEGLVWCGEYNALPTATKPLAGLEVYSHRKSAIFPHAKLAMRSVAAMKGEGTKFNYTTGTVTQHNYIQKREGLIAEHHHSYSAVLAEVDDQNHWWVRQVSFDDKGDCQDLDVVVRGGKVFAGQPVEAVTWGDLHATWVDEGALALAMDMLDALRPKYQFLHDVMEGVSTNRHQTKDKNPHVSFWRWLRGFHRVDAELAKTAEVMAMFKRNWSKVVVPDANHDGWWLKSWLAKYDYRVDPANSELFLDMQKWFYGELRSKPGRMPKEVNLTEYALRKFGVDWAEFLLADESYKTCGGKIENGMHGHLGPGGSRGTPENLSKVGRRANIGHTHTAGIWDGLYVAGTMAKLDWDYTYGPSSQSHSHVLTYPNGMRSIVTDYAGKWRA